MHSMLALSASELLEDEHSSDLACTAIHHRLLAIKSLNESISRGCHTFEDANAMLATCYTLTHQSALLEDGITEYMTFIRGCVKVLWHMGTNNLPLLFKNVLSDAQLQTMGPHFQGEPVLPAETVMEAVRSLEAFEHMCATDGERLMHKYILETAHGVMSSKREAYIGLMHMYGCFCWEMTQPDFEIFIRPDNEAAKLLQTHFVSVQSLLDDITIKEQGKRLKEKKNNGELRWMRTLLRDISDDLRPFYEWPIKQTKMVRSRGKEYWNTEVVDLESPTTKIEVEEVEEISDGELMEQFVNMTSLET
jgi:hypothetical protein